MKNVDARKRLLAVLPFLRVAAEEAEKKGEFRLGILALDTAGQVLCSFEGRSFLDDLAEVLEAEEITAEQRMDVAATKILQQFGAENIQNTAVE